MVIDEHPGGELLRQPCYRSEPVDHTIGPASDRAHGDRPQRKDKERGDDDPRLDERYRDEPDHRVDESALARDKSPMPMAHEEDQCQKSSSERGEIRAESLIMKENISNDGRADRAGSQESAPAQHTSARHRGGDRHSFVSDVLPLAVMRPATQRRAYAARREAVPTVPIQQQVSPKFQCTNPRRDLAARAERRPMSSRLFERPSDLPVPIDDGAAAHLTGALLPAIGLPATSDATVRLDAIERAVLFFFPRTGVPDRPTGSDWDAIPGARGCTPQSCGFRDTHARFCALGLDVYGVSTQ